MTLPCIIHEKKPYTCKMLIHSMHICVCAIVQERHTLSKKIPMILQCFHPLISIFTDSWKWIIVGVICCVLIVVVVIIVVIYSKRFVSQEKFDLILPQYNEMSLPPYGIRTRSYINPKMIDLFSSIQIQKTFKECRHWKRTPINST